MYIVLLVDASTQDRVSLAIFKHGGNEFVGFNFSDWHVENCHITDSYEWYTVFATHILWPYYIRGVFCDVWSPGSDLIPWCKFKRFPTSCYML